MDGEEGAHDVAIVNARIWTGDPKRRWSDALLARDGRIAAIGSSAEVMKRVTSDTRMIDARGRFVCPAFTDAHADPLSASAGSHDSAFVPFEARETGTLERGKPADVVMFDRDLTRATPDEIREARVMMTMVAGRVVYAASDL